MKQTRLYNTAINPGRLQGGWIKSAVLSIVVLLAGAGVTAAIFMTEPKATRVGATKETAMLVEVTTVRRDTYHPVISAMGTVKAADDLLLGAKVAGVVTALSDVFVPGGHVKKGQMLLRIEAADYKNALLQRRSELRRANAELEIEMGRQNVAKNEFALIDEPLSEANKALILRKPQLNVAKAKVEAAEAAVAQAELDLKRTRIKAPFDAHILSRDVNVGSRVSPGDRLGRLVGVDKYWIETTVPLAKLSRIDVSKSPDSPGSKALIRHRTAWAAGVFREGRVDKLLGALESETRMARVLVSVDDPLGYGSETDKPALIIGSYVETHIQAKAIPDVYRLRRAHIRKNDTVWVMTGERLDIRPVEIMFRDDDYVYIKTGLKETDKVVTTNLSTVARGAKLRVEPPKKRTAPEEAGR